MTAALDSNGQSWPIPHNQVRQRLEDLSASSPRFLFRAWSDESGGAKELGVDLNLETSIRPAFFALNPDRVGTYSIHSLERNHLGKMCWSHLRWKYVHGGTMFSSWSQDIQTCLNFCHYKGCEFLSVIDTTKLKPENMVLYTPRLREIIRRDTPAQYDDEFLIFGVIEGDALSCVSFKTIEDVGLRLLLPQNMNRTNSTKPGTLDELLASAELKKDADGQYLEQALYGPKAWLRGEVPRDFEYYMGIAWKIGKLYSKRFKVVVSLVFVCLAPWYCDSQVEFPESMKQRFGVTEAEWVDDGNWVHQDFRFQSIDVRSPWKMALFLLQQVAREAQEKEALVEQSWADCEELLGVTRPEEAMDA